MMRLWDYISANKNWSECFCIIAIKNRGGYSMLEIKRFSFLENR